MNVAEWWRGIVRRTAEQTSDPLVREWLSEIAEGGEFVALSRDVQPRRLLASADVEAEDVDAVLTWLGTAG